MNFDPAQLAYVPTTGPPKAHETPLVRTSDDSLKGYGCILRDPHSFPVEIVRWPAQGWRPVDANSGDQGGVTEGILEAASPLQCWFPLRRRHMAETLGMTGAHINRTLNQLRREGIAAVENERPIIQDFSGLPGSQAAQQPRQSHYV